MTYTYEYNFIVVLYIVCCVSLVFKCRHLPLVSVASKPSMQCEFRIASHVTKLMLLDHFNEKYNLKIKKNG